MREVVRSNDPVRLSFLTALLAESGIEAVMMDLHASIMEGSIGALERRLMVLDEDYERARALLEEAGEGW